MPPEPPPLPRMGPPILVGLTLIVLGLVLVTFPGWVGVPQVYGLPLGLVAIAAGLGWLVLRLWPDNSDGKPPPHLPRRPRRPRWRRRPLTGARLPAADLGLGAGHELAGELGRPDHGGGLAELRRADPGERAAPPAGEGRA